MSPPHHPGEVSPFLAAHQSNVHKAKWDLTQAPHSPGLTLGSQVNGWCQAVPTGPSATHRHDLSPALDAQLLTEKDQLSCFPERTSDTEVDTQTTPSLKTLCPQPANPLTPTLHTPSQVFIFLELQCSSWGRMDTSISSFGSSLAKV